MLYVGQKVTLRCVFRAYRVDLAYSSTVQARACMLAGVLDEFGGPRRHQVVTVTELRTNDAFMQAVRSRSCDGLVSGWGDGSGTLGEESAAVACSSNPRGLHQETGPHQSTSAVRTVSWVFHSRYVGLSVAVMVCGTDGGRCNSLQHWSVTCPGMKMTQTLWIPQSHQEMEWCGTPGGSNRNMEMKTFKLHVKKTACVYR